MRSIFLIIVFGLLVLPTGCAQRTAMDRLTGSPGAVEAPLDLQFIDTMIRHHEDGILMMEKAQTKSSSAALRDLAGRMEKANHKDIADLKSIRAELYPNAREAVNMDFPGMRPMVLDSLDSHSGEVFDRHWIGMVIEHHEGAIGMARSAIARGSSEQLKAKARRIREAQRREIRELKHLRSIL